MKHKAWLSALGIVLASGFLAGCAYDRASTVERLKADNPRDQTAAMAEAVRADDKTVIPVLIDLLESEDEGVRFMSAAALRRLTGEDKGFQLAKEADRPQIVAKWRRWLEDEGPRTAPASSVSPKSTDGRAAPVKSPA